MSREPSASGIAERLRAADTEPSVEAWAAAVLRVLLEAIPGISGSFNEINLPAGRVSGLIEPPFTPEQMALMPVYQAHHPENPLLRHHLETGSIRAQRWRDVDPGGDLLGSTLYRDFYAPLGVQDQLGVALATPPGVLVAIVLNRGEGQFTDRERCLLDAVQPFLAAGYQAARRRSLGERFETLAMADGWAVLVVDDRGTLEGASGFLGEHSMFEPSALLPEPLLGWFESLDPDRQPWGRGRPTDAVELTLPDGTPLQARAAFGAVPPHVVLIKVPAESNPVRRLTGLGLSAREAEVAVALATGGTNRQIARQLGIAEGTIRKHLQRIYERLGVDNRAAAVAVVLRATLSPETMAN